MAGDSRQRPGPRARLRVIIATGISAAGVAGGAEVVAFVVGVDPKWPVAPCDSCRRPQTASWAPIRDGCAGDARLGFVAAIAGLRIDRSNQLACAHHACGAHWLSETRLPNSTLPERNALRIDDRNSCRMS
jgi:hypothetical protein